MSNARTMSGAGLQLTREGGARRVDGLVAGLRDRTRRSVMTYRMRGGWGVGPRETISPQVARRVAEAEAT
jgi:hypothetical protein